EFGLAFAFSVRPREVLSDDRRGKRPPRCSRRAEPDMVTTTAERGALDGTSAPPDQLLVSFSSEEPIRAELYGLEHLEAHARSLDHACFPDGQGAPGDPLLRRFRENGAALTRAYAEIVATARTEALGA